jgi:predicted RNA binding protein YcfA (HicA-like mRNA interferase family)
LPVSPKLPQISGQELVRFLDKLGYHIVRQKGSHIRFRKTTGVGEYNITVLNHRVIAKGTLNDIITKVSLWNNINKDDLIKMF